MSVGQAPGVKEPVLGRPFAWTAGKTLFGWFAAACGWSEADCQKLAGGNILRVMEAAEKVAASLKTEVPSPAQP